MLNYGFQSKGTPFHYSPEAFIELPVASGHAGGGKSVELSITSAQPSRLVRATAVAGTLNTRGGSASYLTARHHA